MTTKDNDTWATNDGREIPLDEMHRPHIQNAWAVLHKWLKGEQDPDVRKDLAKWKKRFRKELSKRERAYQESKRNASS